MDVRVSRKEEQPVLPAAEDQTRTLTTQTRTTGPGGGETGSNRSTTDAGVKFLLLLTDCTAETHGTHHQHNLFPSLLLS